jgi:hypothetical protein
MTTIRLRRVWEALGSDFGRHVLGLAALGFGLIALTWPDLDAWQQLRTLWSSAPGRVIVYCAAGLEIIGGVAIQWRRTAPFGAALLVSVYVFFAGRWIPRIFNDPLSYDNWGNLFEQLALVSGALIVYASTAMPADWATRVGRVGRYLFGVCVISFTLEQLLYLHGTAQFVPTWIPPGQMFWAITTTAALAAAAAAILTGHLIVPATRWLTLMFLLFGLLLWLPRLLIEPSEHLNWGGNAQNLALTAAAWILAGWVSQAHRRGRIDRSVSGAAFSARVSGSAR